MKLRVVLLLLTLAVVVVLAWKPFIAPFLAEPVRLVSPSERFLIASAIDLLVADCMWSEGFHAFPELPQIPERIYPKTDRRAHEPWGWDDPDRARATGYGITNSLRFDAAQPSAVVREDLYQAWWQPVESSDQADAAYSLHGPVGDQLVLEMAGIHSSTPVEGCVAQAREELFDGLENFLLYDAYRNRIGDGGIWEARSVPSYESALSNWSDCFGDETGISVETPLDAYGHVFRTEGASIDFELESTVAVADALCNQRVGLARTGDQALEIVRRRMARDLHEVTQRFEQLMGAVLRDANEVMETEDRYPSAASTS